MSISYVHRQLSRSPLLGSRGRQGTCKTVGPGAQPRPPLPLLAPGLTEGGGAHQRVPRRRPAIRMGVMRVVDVKRIDQTGCQVLRRTAGTALKKTTRQDTQPPLDLLEPRSLLGRHMEPRLM